MKIAVWHNTGPGGARRYLYDHVRELLARGHEVGSWCLSTAEQKFLPLGGLVRERVVSVPDGILAEGWSSVGKATSLVDRACRQCAEEINAGGYDVLLATNCRLTVVPPIARYVEMPSVLYLQEPRRRLYEAIPDLLWAATPSREAPWHSPRRVARMIRERREWRRCRRAARDEKAAAACYDTILVNSLFSRESVLRAYGLNSSVCYMGIDARRFHGREAGREGFVLGVGEFSFHKNISFAIDTIATMSQPRPRLVWAGNGGSKSYIQDLRNAAALLGVEFDPVFGVTDEELMGLYGRAGVLLYAPRLEPFGLVPLEANACGLPVVAVAEGGVRESVRDGVNGFLVEANPSAAAEAVALLLRDASLNADIGRKARASVEAFWSLQKSAPRLEARLLEACARREA